MRTALTRAYRVLADCLGPFTTSRTAAAATKAVPPSLTGESRRSSRNRAGVSMAGGALFERLEGRAMMSATYYVSNTGNDSNNGTSINTPWKTIGKINSSNFKLGDTILLKGGQTFGGTMRFSPGDGGSDGGYVEVSSYGGGRATVSSGGGNGAYVFDTSGIWFENLKFQGSPGGLQQYGIVFETTYSNYKRANIRVDNCEVTGYNGSGIMVMGDTYNAGFTNVQITSNNIHGNVQTGIYTYAVTQRAIDNVYVINNQVYDNYGDGHSYVTGGGIQIGDVEGATVEYNCSYDNGITGGNGSVGIWAYESDRVLFAYNESYNNHGYRGHDGDGFDFDADTSNSIMEYNYAANNDGTGYQLDQWRNNSSFTNDIVRYNVSQNNGQRNNYGGIEAWGKVLNSYFYNNVVYLSPAQNGGSPSGMHVYNTTIAGLYVSNVHFANNIIISTGGLRMVFVSAAEASGATDLTFTGNLYYAQSGTANFSYGNHSYYSLASFANSTGQEKINGRIVGLQTNPMLQSPGNAWATASAYSMSSVTAYKPLENSPVFNSGINVSATYGLGSVEDYFSQSITGRYSDIGLL